MKSIKITLLLFYLIIINLDLQATDNMELTFAMIKPYAVKKELINEILAIIEQAGFTIVTTKAHQLTQQQVYELYKDRAQRRWFAAYVRAMILSPVLLMVLEKENAVQDWSKYKKIIREKYTTICKKNNVVHGSDTIEDAQREIALFFKE